MKKILKGIFILFIIFVFFQLSRFIIFPFADNILTSVLQPKIKSGSEYKTKEICEKQGGDWGKSGIFPVEFCRIPANDGGKQCISGFQCKTGKCITRYNFRNAELFAIGTCPKYSSVFGCIQQVHFGFRGSGICLD